MALTQEKVLQKVDKLVSTTQNFPSLIHEAEAMSLINRHEKETILSKFKLLPDKLTSFYLLVSSKGNEILGKLPDLLEITGNEGASNALFQDDEEPSHLDFQSQQIMDNLDRLCSHTVNPGLVLSFATGLELISGTERELMDKQCRTDEEQLEAFFALVATKGPRALEKLAQVLSMTNNHWALQVLHCDHE